QGHRATDRAGGAWLYRGAACRRAHRSRRLRAAPPDRRAVEATVARDRRTAARSRDRRAVHVLPDPRPDGPRLDLAAQHHARHRPRDGARQREGCVGWAERSVPTIYQLARMVGTLRFAHPTDLRAYAFSSASTVATAGRSSIRLRCAATFGSLDRSTP